MPRIMMFGPRSYSLPAMHGPNRPRSRLRLRRRWRSMQPRRLGWAQQWHLPADSPCRARQRECSKGHDTPIKELRNWPRTHGGSNDVVVIGTHQGSRIPVRVVGDGRPASRLNQPTTVRRISRGKRPRHCTGNRSAHAVAANTTCRATWARMNQAPRSRCALRLRRRMPLS